MNVKFSVRSAIMILLIIAIGENVSCQKLVTFPSLDSLPITADLYTINDTAEYIVLCHLAQHSRGEYRVTARNLNAAGYNCLAIDTRTGGEIFGILNETNRHAKLFSRSTNFLDSEMDIIASINYADSLGKGKGILLLGSSFSASLSLKIAASNDKVKAVISFSPGEHFGDACNLSNAIKNLDKPVFITSSKDEATDVAKLFKVIASKEKVHFIPKEKGSHGSIALWDYTPNHQEYWKALLEFFRSLESRTSVQR